MAFIRIILFAFVFVPFVDGTAFALSSPAQLQESEAESADLDAALSRMKDKHPKLYLRMLETREANPERYERFKERALREYRRIQKLQRLVPANVSLQEEMWQNRARLSQIMRNMRKAEAGPGRVILESQMEKTLTEQFDLKVKMKRNRLDRAEALLQKRIQDLDAERDRKEEFVSRWKDRLMARIAPGSDVARSRNAAPKRKRKQ